MPLLSMLPNDQGEHGIEQQCGSGSKVNSKNGVWYAVVVSAFTDRSVGSLVLGHGSCISLQIGLLSRRTQRVVPTADGSVFDRLGLVRSCTELMTGPTLKS